MQFDVLNRSDAPSLNLVDKLDIRPAEKLTLKNGIPVYVINMGVQDVCSIDVEFHAGKWHEPQRLAARFTNQMLKEGTAKHTAYQISETFDFYGASFRNSAGSDTASAAVFSLNKHLSEVLPLFAEIIREPVFPENELNLALTNGREELKINRSKNDYLADKKFSRSLHGNAHPYGYEQMPEDFDNIHSGLLKDFHKRFYNSANCFIMVAGKVEDKTISLLEKYFGGNDWQGSLAESRKTEPVAEKEKKTHEKKKDAVQSAIRIGRKLFNKTHPDFQKLHVLNTIFGGYFGSRLMSNIREDKGFTYGIHSALSSKIHGGHFYISTEVGVDVCEQAVKEIYFEMERLKTELVPDDELQLVRNYLSGKLLSGLDGPFRLAEMYKGLILYNQDVDYIYSLLNVIKTLQAKELRELAQKYFDFEEMHEIIIG